MLTPVLCSPPRAAPDPHAKLGFMTRRLIPVLALALAACAPAPVAPPSVAPSASAAPSVAPSTTTAPSTAPSAIATPATPAASPSTPSTPATGVGGTLRGQAFDIDGQPLAGVAVQVRSLDLSAPYDQAATTDATGAWSVAGVPIGAQVEARATKAGWTPRVVLGGVGQERIAVLDFGGPAGRFAGAFMSPYPEIAATSPLADAEIPAGADLAYQVTLSEPLDAANRQRFEEALAILPADTIAAGGAGSAGADDLRDTEDNYPLARAINGLAPYAIAAGTSFRAEPGRRARVEWSADGLTATLRFGATLIASRGGNARYQAVLRAGAEPIRDAEGLPLGTGPTGALGSWPAAGGLVLAAFRTRDLALPTIDELTNGSPAARWAATHDNLAGFTLAQDDTTPRLVEVRVDETSSDTRLLLTFDESLAAYDGTDGGRLGAGTGQAAAHLGQVTFAVGDRRALEALDLEGAEDGDARVLDPRILTSFGAADADRANELVFDTGAYRASAVGAPDGAVTLEVDAADARTLAITLHGRRRFFDRDLAAIRVRVEGVADPAGNDRGSRLADDDQMVFDL